MRFKDSEKRSVLLRRLLTGCLVATLVIISVLFLGVSSCGPKKVDTLPKVELKVDGKVISVELADTPSAQMAGLMFRKTLAPDAGMLFAFPDSGSRSFWMKNTYIPLSIAYIDEKGVILNILEMPPRSEESYYSKGPAKFALEMNSGWFLRKGVQAGDFIEGLSSIRTK